jgi:jumonji domain-containing protein 2
LKDLALHGINRSFLYVGAWKSLFAWHKEDYDLYSINYMHFGRPKYWYGINLNDSEKFEAVAHSYFGDNLRECP